MKSYSWMQERKITWLITPLSNDRDTDK
jgi:hypothetical protein